MVAACPVSPGGRGTGSDGLISPRGLLDVARSLAEGGSEESRRRAVSTAYYALFHLLVESAATRMFPGPDRARLRDWLARAFAHRNMKTVAEHFVRDPVGEKLGHALGERGLRDELKDVAHAFVDLQSFRHEADYDRTCAFGFDAAREAVDTAETAFEQWNAVRGTIQADVFLAALLAFDKVRATAARR